MTHTASRPTAVLVAAIAAFWLAGAAGSRAADTPDATKVDLSVYYGFEQLEIFKLEQRSHSLLASDLNGDGLRDLMVVDNSHSRLDLLEQRSEKPDSIPSASSSSSVNYLENHWRFEHRKIPVDKQVESLALGDFNGDGRRDAAYFGAPDRLIVRFQTAEDDWTQRKSFRLPDVEPAQWNLAAGDLDGDGRDDLAVLGQYETFIIYQQQDGTLSAGTRLMNTSEKLALAQIADVDGDARHDLCYVSGDGQQRVLCVRFQSEDGQLGPELRFDLERTRAITLFDVDKQPGNEVLTIDSQTGRVEMLKLRRPDPDSKELAARLIQYGFGRQGSRGDRDLATGDIDGDGLSDVVVTDPKAAQIIVFRQTERQRLDLGSAYPGLMDSQQVRVSDFDGDGAGEIVVLSVEEKTVGLSRFSEGRITFPQSLPVGGDPIAVEVADLNDDGVDEVVYISRERDGRSSRYLLQALARDDDGSWKPHLFAGPQGVALELRGTPSRLVHLDANNDNRPDFLVFLELDRAPHLLAMNEQGVPTEVTTQRGIRLGNMSPGAVFIGHGEETLILAAQNNFARRLQLDEDQQWRVIDQYNAAESSARIEGAAVIDLDGQPGREVVLVDSGIQKLRVLRREDGLFRRWTEVEIGQFPFESTRVADLNGDGSDDLLLFGRGKFAVLYANRVDPVLTEITSFETTLDDTFFSDVVAGDLNGDGHTDLAVIDTRSHYVEILDYDRQLGLRHALHFKVFQEKSLIGENVSTGEPREALIADVTGDERPDLILLAHDRVLIYPQDDGK